MITPLPGVERRTHVFREERIFTYPLLGELKWVFNIEFPAFVFFGVVGIFEKRIIEFAKLSISLWLLLSLRAHVIGSVKDVCNRIIIFSSLSVLCKGSFIV